MSNKYIIRENIAPRSWKKVPWAYYVYGTQIPSLLSEEEFRVLLLCDGKNTIDNPQDKQIVDKLIEKEIIKEAEPEDKISKWQQYRDCKNLIVPYITLEITQKCNFKCLHCFNAADLDVPRNELSYEQICDILDQALECGIQNVLITGGEPMLHPRFMDIMHAIYDHGLVVYELNTNGYYLTPEILKEMKDSDMRPKFKVSFDGLGFHDVMRNAKGCEKRTLDAIDMCVEHGFNTKINFQMNKRNIECILPTLLKLDEMGVEETRIIRTTEAPRWSMTSPELSLSWSEFYEQSLNIAFEYCKHNVSMVADFWTFLTVDPIIKNYWCANIKYNEKSFNTSRPLCTCVRGNISIGANGNAYPCLQMSGAFDGLNVCLGNVLETPLQQLLNDSLYAKLAHSCIQDRIDKNGRCKDCPFLKYCGGGCAALGIIFNSDYYGSDNTACLFYRDKWHKKISSLFSDWHDGSLIPDDIDTKYLEDLNFDEVSNDNYVHSAKIG